MDHLATNINYLIAEVEKGGAISIEVYVQEDRSLYASVSGLGVRSGGYNSVAEALTAWRDAKEFDAQGRMDYDEARFDAGVY
jgi:hypothetical protein